VIDDANPAIESDPALVRARARAARLEQRGGEDIRGLRGTRFGNFLRACWAELQRVQWPDRRAVAQATGVVLGFVLVAGAYLGLLDLVFSKIMNRIL
jgi:preprotein translocase SecE subunit